MPAHFYENLELISFGERPFIACNMVTSLDGKVTSGGSLKPGSLGSPFDRMTMNVIRSHFDAILMGGNTTRAHPFYLGVPRDLEESRTKKGLASQPLTVLLTKSGKLDPSSPLFANPPRPPVIITTATGANALSPDVLSQSIVEILAETYGPQEICQVLLKKHQVKRLLLEGGPSINYQFLQAELLDEFFITLAPRLVGANDDLSMVMGQEVLRRPEKLNLVSTLQHGDELFLRYKLTW